MYLLYSDFFHLKIDLGSPFFNKIGFFLIRYLLFLMSTENFSFSVYSLCLPTSLMQIC